MISILSTREYVIRNLLVQFGLLKIRVSGLKLGIKPLFCEEDEEFNNLHSIFG